MNRTISAALVAIVAVSGQATHADPQTPARGRRAVPPEIARTVHDVFTAYEAGDDLAVERWFGTTSARSAIPYFEALLAQPAPWSRARAAFILEVAWQMPFAPEGTLTAGRATVAARPTVIGADPREDRFEVLWHQTALGLLQRMPSVDAQLDYLAAVEPRFEDAARRGVALDTRFPLARAFATGLLCCWKPHAGEIVRNLTSVHRGGSTLDRALALFEKAALTPSLRAEACVRGAKLLFDAGRPDDARTWLARVPDHDDSLVGVVQHLVSGRVFDALDRPDAAADAYGRAVALAPTSQLAAVGLAAALLRAGRADDARRAAESARRLQEGPPLPATFSRFNRADFRFVPAWLAEIRSLRR